MRLIPLLILSMVVLYSCNQSGGNSSEKTSEKTTIQNTTFDIEEEIIDLGKMISGEILLHTVVINNTGSHDLLVERVEVDCGCVQAKIIDKRILPGEKGHLEIEFDSSGLFGKQLKSIVIHANSKELKHLAIFAQIENENIEINY